MRRLLVLAAHSAWNRRATLAITAVAIALSVALLLAVDRVRDDARETFARSISGTDLVVGPRGSGVALLLHAVFHIGGAAQQMRWDSFRAIAERPEVAWAVPLALGDSHRGFPVLATTPAYFEHVRYADGRALAVQRGRWPATLFETAIGAEVAETLGLRPGDRIALAHGSEQTDLAGHADKPFVVSAVLARTGTPVDRTLHIGLDALEAIHLDWQGGARIPGFAIPPELVRKFDLAPKAISAALVGLKNRAAVLGVQRDINDDGREPLLAVLPAVALDELWQLVGVAERALFVVSALVFAVGLAGLIAVILAGLGERRRELAVLRAVGARPLDVCVLLSLEALFVTVAGIVLAVVAVDAATAFAAPLLQSRWGVVVGLRPLSASEWRLLADVVAVTVVASLLPGWRAYRMSLADGLSPRL